VFNLEPGEAVEVDETVAVIETDKVSVEIKAPKAGVLTKFHAKVGEDLAVGKPFFDIDTEGKA
jgi:2-oxoglutarate dehydrogenase E2 component (dihydrolipoamide succinyltransferase)